MNLSTYQGFDEFPPQVMKNVDAYDQMVSIRLEYKEKLMKNTNTISVSQENIFDDLIKAYKKRGVSSKELRITFIDEDAVGDGVTRDAYASFFNALYAKFEEEKEKIPPLDMDEETLILIGKIITHAFIQYGQFPHKICHAAILHHLYGITEDEHLLSSYFNYIPDQESEMIKIFSTHGQEK